MREHERACGDTNGLKIWVFLAMAGNTPVPVAEEHVPHIDSNFLFSPRAKFGNCVPHGPSRLDCAQILIPCPRPAKRRLQGVPFLPVGLSRPRPPPPYDRDAG